MCTGAEANVLIVWLVGRGAIAVWLVASLLGWDERVSLQVSIGLAMYRRSNPFLGVSGNGVLP